MFRRRCNFIFIALILSPVHLYAHVPKRGKVIATAGPVFFQRQVELSYGGVDNPLRAGFMIAAEGDVDQNGGVEITLGYMQKRYFKKVGESVLVEDAKRIHTSTGYRHWFNPRHSASIGLFTSYSIGDVDTIEDRLAPGAERFNTSAEKSAEDGLDFTYQYDYLTFTNVAVMIGLSYSYSFSASDTESPYIYGAMVGIRHFIQGREPDSSLMSR